MQIQTGITPPRGPLSSPDCGINKVITHLFCSCRNNATTRRAALWSSANICISCEVGRDRQQKSKKPRRQRVSTEAASHHSYRAFLLLASPCLGCIVARTGSKADRQHLLPCWVLCLSSAGYKLCVNMRAHTHTQLPAKTRPPGSSTCCCLSSFAANWKFSDNDK